MNLLVALMPDDLILLQINEGDKALAHVKLTSAEAHKLGTDLMKLASTIKRGADVEESKEAK